MTLTHITTEQAEAAALARVAELETFLQGVITELRARIAELEAKNAALRTEGARAIRDWKGVVKEVAALALKDKQ